MTSINTIKTHSILGVRIAALSIPAAVQAVSRGGLILAPSAPGLATLFEDPHYAEALLAADINLPDSGLAIGLMRLLGLGVLPRTSGLGFLKALIDEPRFKASGASFWIMPNWASLQKNLQWLQSKGITIHATHTYVAPIYPSKGAFSDEALLRRIKDTKPSYIFVCLGGGIQEKLGYWLKINLPFRPAIICIGAAIGFLSGDQVKIPRWVDQFCLGWMLRCLSQPSRFVPRYIKALRLIYLVFRYRDRSPLFEQQ